MSFLAKLLSALKRVAQIEGLIEPAVVQALPQGGVAQTKVSQIADDFTRISEIVQNGAGIAAALKPGVSPAEEAEAVSPLVTQALLKAEALLGKKVKDEQKFAAGSTNIALGVRQILDSVE